MAKQKPDTSFNFGANVQQPGKKPKRPKRRQTASDRQMYAIAARTGMRAAYGGS
jgi:hypothetical protein